MCKTFIQLFSTALICFGPLASADTSQRIAQAEEGFDLRWDIFEKDHAPFSLWKKEQNTQELKEQFDRLLKQRMAIYFVDPPSEEPWEHVPTSQELYQGINPLKNALYPLFVNFSYNLASEDYNANIITIHGLKFLALEAPQQKNVDFFFKLLTDYDISSLVRLTPRFELHKQRECSFPYWEGRQNIHPQTGHSTLHIAPNEEINYYQTDCWVNHQGEGPQRVIALIKALQKSTPPKKMIAIHCRMGVGRTGTLIAAYTLIHDIDRQLAAGTSPEKIQVSIEKLVYELSLQRPFMVTHFVQYQTLHEIVTHYLGTKEAQNQRLDSNHE